MDKAIRYRSIKQTELGSCNLQKLRCGGILTQEEYESKKAAIQRESELAGKIKQLENARDAGIISCEEYKRFALVV
ncbi:MAG: SHOCT domain-containing protein [Nostoc sp.]